MSNLINHPNHYGGDGVYEVFKVAEAWGFWEDAALFNVLKYIARAGKKDKSTELQDLEKAKVYLDKKISKLKPLEPSCKKTPTSDEIKRPTHEDLLVFNIVLQALQSQRGNSIRA